MSQIQPTVSVGLPFIRPQHASTTVKYAQTFRLSLILRLTQGQPCAVTTQCRRPCTLRLSCCLVVQGRVLRALWTVHWRRLATAAGFRLLQNLCAWSGPFLLQQLLSHLQAGAAICKL